ncbi:MAG: hypothetical protein CL555_09705 [Algoriphagus sp.]|nr:hypothetical protein [Algoriphagus sp.]
MRNLRNSYLFPLVFVLLIAFACSKSPKSSEIVKLQASGEFLRIPIDSPTANISTGLVRYKDFLVNVNWNTNTLKFMI